MKGDMGTRFTCNGKPIYHFMVSRTHRMQGVCLGPVKGNRVSHGIWCTVLHIHN